MLVSQAGTLVVFNGEFEPSAQDPCTILTVVSNRTGSMSVGSFGCVQSPRQAKNLHKCIAVLMLHI